MVVNKEEFFSKLKENSADILERYRESGKSYVKKALIWDYMDFTKSHSKGIRIVQFLYLFVFLFYVGLHLLFALIFELNKNNILATNTHNFGNYNLIII